MSRKEGAVVGGEGGGEGGVRQAIVDRLRKVWSRFVFQESVSRGVGSLGKSEVEKPSHFADVMSSFSASL